MGGLGLPLLDQSPASPKLGDGIEQVTKMMDPGPITATAQRKMTAIDKLAELHTVTNFRAKSQLQVDIEEAARRTPEV